MLREFLKRLAPRRYDLYRDEVYTRNNENLGPYVVVGLGMTLASIVTQLAIERNASFPLMVVLFIYFLALTVAYFAIGDRVKATTAVMYGIQIPVMLVAIWMGTAFDPDTPSITFLMFLVTFPLFLLDKWWRVVSYVTGLLVVYLACAVLFVSDPEILRVDMVHVLSFYVASVVVCLFVLAVRFESVENRCKLRDRSEHDELTGLKNRFALRADFGGYQRVPVCVLMCDIDLFKHFNDEYGHAVGDEVIARFAHAFEDEFGTGGCYRYGGDELLVIARDMEPDAFEAGLKRIQAKLARVTLGGRIAGGISCSCGFSYGEARTGDELRAMLALADEQLYEVKESGRGGIRSAVFDKAAMERLSAVEDDPHGDAAPLRNHHDMRG